MMPNVQSAIATTAAGGLDVLCERVPAQLGSDDVLIEVAAAGINRHDCNQRAAGPSREPNPCART